MATTRTGTAITITDPSSLERIQQRVESGEYADAVEVLSRALNSLEVQENIRKVRALIAEAEASIAEHGSIPWTPTLFAEILEQAREANRRGDPIADHVKG